MDITNTTYCCRKNKLKNIKKISKKGLTFVDCFSIIHIRWRRKGDDERTLKKTSEEREARQSGGGNRNTRVGGKVLKKV